MPQNYILVQPTGGDDTQSLQAAVDAATFPTSSVEQGCLALSGVYKITDTLHVGGDGKRPVSMDASHAVLQWASNERKWMLEYSGGGVSSPTFIRGIRFIGANKAKGLWVQGQTECDLIDRCCIEGTMECGLFLDHCYSGSLTNTKFRWCRGVALKTDNANSHRFASLHFGNCRGLWHADYKRDAELAAYELLHGEVATGEKHGADYRSAWGEGQQACVVAAGHHQLWQSVQFEQCRYGERPLVWTDAELTTWDHTRFEGNLSRLKWVVEGGVKRGGRNLTFAATTLGEGEPYAKCLVELRGTTDHIRVSGGILVGLDRAVVCAPAGQTAIIENVTTRNRQVVDMAT